MANQIYKIFPNKVELFKFFGIYAPELNVAISCRLPINGFAVGSVHKAFRTFPEFIGALGEMSGLDVCTRTSTFRMGTFIIFFNSAIPNPNRRGKAVEAVVEAPVVVEEVAAPVVEEKAAPVIDVDALVAQAAALNDEADKKGSKDKLAEFAEASGVALAKNKTFDNMLADFKAALETK